MLHLLPRGCECCTIVENCGAEAQAARHSQGPRDRLLLAEALEPISVLQGLLTHGGKQDLSCKWQQQFLSGGGYKRPKSGWTRRRCSQVVLLNKQQRYVETEQEMVCPGLTVSLSYGKTVKPGHSRRVGMVVQ